MFGIHCRPKGRLFLLATILVAIAASAQSGPPLTAVQDTVYRADGTPAQGTLLISWPAFTTANSQAVAAGSTNVTLGSNGSLAVSLVSNANATPVNTVYSVIYQLNDGTVRTEYWIVPTTSPANLAAVRTTLGTSTAASQMVTQQYVNSAVAGKANDSAVVHNTGNENISGVKTFASPPSSPTPQQAGDVANKQYVDNAVQNNGGGSYLSTAGGTMSGALVLAADGSRLAQVIRKLNKPAELRVSLVATSASFIVPAAGARIMLGKANGQDVFTGYLMQVPAFEYLGWGEQGPVYRYNLIAQSDEVLLNEKRLPDRCPFVERSAGNALRQLTQDLVPGIFDLSQAQELDLLAWFASDPQKTWGELAADITVQARASYRVFNSALVLSPLGANAYALDESDPDFDPQGLTLQAGSTLINDITVVGEVEPQAYVKDYFIGDGLTYKFYLSQTPFTKTNTTLFDEEYTVSPLEPTLWNVVDPNGAVSVSEGALQIAGGNGVDGSTKVEFVEQIELGGAVIIEHGDVMFSAASTGVIGGLYPGAVSIAGCLAGFSITPNGSQSNIQALVSGALTGSAITTTTGHHYVLTTRIYSQEIYRRQQVFHSSLHPAGSGIGGAQIAGDVRIVLEVHEIDPTNPETEVAPATVLYDNVITAAPNFCTYALINSADLQCSISFTRLIHAVDTEVRSAMPGLSYVTDIVGPLAEGAECNVTSSRELEFYSAYVPAANQQVEVHYRGQGRALARVTNPASIAAQQRGVDNGLHGAVRHVKEPAIRTSADCENAALALFDDTTVTAWTGQYECWSDFLPGDASDIFPGDGLNVIVPSRNATFPVIVREVEFTINDLEDEHCKYKISFANDSATPLAWEFDGTNLANLPWITSFTNTQIGSTYIADLTDAEITDVTSTTLSIDAGNPPPSGGGIEVRWSDSGWGAGNDRNLVGRFTTATFTIPRLSRVQDCYLRQYDASTPPKYSRFTAALHVDYPL